MSDQNKTETVASTEDAPKKKTLGLKGGTLSLKVGTGAAPSTGGTVVQVRRNRSAGRGAIQTPEHAAPTIQDDNASSLERLTSDERDARAKALQEALSSDGQPKDKLPPPPSKSRATEKMPSTDDARQKELEELQRIEVEEKAKTAQTDAVNQEKFKQKQATAPATFRGPAREVAPTRDIKKPTRNPRTTDRRRGGKITVTQVLNNHFERDRGMSLAAQKRARVKARLASQGPKEDVQKIFHEVIVPETITVQELANRMTERGTDVIRALMKLGVMAMINDNIDADTAELIIEEFGHKIKRITDSDLEDSLSSIEDAESDLLPRAPVVTIMGHVDHGKTSLLDALRKTDVVSGEAGGITQHIGAYQIEVPTGEKITFLDTPGHAAFTEMRSRGANVTDIVVLVVSAADSIMPQTIEAINHAKAAGVPIIVAINKIDLPDANPTKVRQDLLQYELITEDMGGDIQAIEISAKMKTNLDKLIEAILLQAELLELKANPNRPAEGAVVESKMESGRGSVSTILVQKGTLRVGDIFVVGAESGKVRAIIDDSGKQIKEAGPSLPVEILGLSGTPASGAVLNVVENDARAKEVAAFRQHQKREKEAMAVTTNRTFENMLAASKAGRKKILPIVIKGDVHGSVEAIIGSLNKMVEDNEEIGVQILHSGVGGITESDVTLASASDAILIGFNVRANKQARDQSERDNLTLRYYSIIYNVIDDVKEMLGEMLPPSEREEYLGNAEIRQIFNMSKYGKVAGCMITAGQVKRGAKVRLLREDVVIHEGMLKTLKRFKDEVKEVGEGIECGMAFENYEDIQEGDVIECFEIVREARTLA